MGKSETTLGRLLSTTKVSSTGKARGKGRAKTGRRFNVPKPVVGVGTGNVVDDILLASREPREAQRKGDGLRYGRQKREKTIYVLGERPARNKAVPRARDGCTTALQNHQLCAASRRRVQPVHAYNHYQEYCEEREESHYDEAKKDRGEEVMPSTSAVLWEGRGTVSWG